jgi:hypothetical protein
MSWCMQTRCETYICLYKIFPRVHITLLALLWHLPCFTCPNCLELLLNFMGVSLDYKVRVVSAGV